ncbi:hypothetical protein MES4922_370012 [Mesorhizobium ventifaucium]|uniref:Uncharacterized protein n=1 Tax=Mesorhizobium ventifaucium TaxID=666020 RepID=A0ABN8K6Q6_9HYPH|nr:hypothetical protein MES4922_370012 [Mesorhizobium ventifaucium]
MKPVVTLGRLQTHALTRKTATQLARS